MVSVIVAGLINYKIMNSHHQKRYYIIREINEMFLNMQNLINRRIKSKYKKIKIRILKVIDLGLQYTGPCQNNRCLWMQNKQHTNNSEKAYMKIHVAVNAKIKKILSKVTDEHIQDSKAYKNYQQ